MTSEGLAERSVPSERAPSKKPTICRHVALIGKDPTGLSISVEDCRAIACWLRPLAAARGRT